ncbi:MAG: hypothetical protein H6Q71_72 [Firmicutes bacterium]|nr:hypothetical protein [Bacillota bacterium]
MFMQPEDPHGLKSQLTKRPLVLFGMGGMGGKIKAFCEENNIPIACFVDNNTEKQESGQSGGKVLSPQEMKETYPNANILISSAIFFDEIKKQLEFLGFPEDQILSYTLFIPDEITWLDLEKKANWARMRIRVKNISEWIDENDRSVVDYGAGEMFLKNLIHTTSPGGVQYYPIDYIRRSEETILCDLNARKFPRIYADVAVLSGILEFLTTIESLLRHVCATTGHKIILSYITLEKFPNLDGRRASAYVNNFTEQKIIDLLAQNGFILKAAHPDPSHDINTLFLFEKVSP